MKKLNVISNYFIAVAAVLFLAFYLVLSFYNRPAADDIAFISMIKDQTLLHAVKEVFETWSGRWSSWTYLFSVFSISNKLEDLHYFIFAYYCITLFIFVYSINTIIRFSLQKLFDTVLDIKISLAFSILFIAGFFYFIVDHIEAWWWVSASFYYLQGIAFLLFGIAFLMKEKKNLFHYLLITLSFIYVGASFEVYILIIAILFILILLYFLFKRSDESFRLQYKIYSKSILIAFFSFCLSAALCFSAPGNLKRRATLLNQHTTVALGVNPAIFIQKKYMLAIGIAALWIILGMKLKNKSDKIVTQKQLKKMLLIAIIPLVVSILVTWFFQVFILYNTTMPLRGWTFTSLSMTFFCCTLFLYAGYFIQIQSPYLQFSIKIILPVIIVFALSWNFIKQYNYTNRYATQYDQLIGKLMNARADKNKNVLSVKELPPSGMLIPLDIKDCYITIPLKKILELNYEITIEK